MLLSGWISKNLTQFNGVGQAKILHLLTRWLGRSKKGLKSTYVIHEWSVSQRASKILAFKVEGLKKKSANRPWP